MLSEARDMVQDKTEHRYLNPKVQGVQTHDSHVAWLSEIGVKDIFYCRALRSPDYSTGAGMPQGW
jgi:hypothetical protein